MADDFSFHYHFKPLGNASLEIMGWTFSIVDGELRVADPGHSSVILLGRQFTEEFVSLVIALDRGRRA